MERAGAGSQCVFCFGCKRNTSPAEESLKQRYPHAKRLRTGEREMCENGSKRAVEVMWECHSQPLTGHGNSVSNVAMARKDTVAPSQQEEDESPLDQRRFQNHSKSTSSSSAFMVPLLLATPHRKLAQPEEAPTTYATTHDEPVGQHLHPCQNHAQFAQTSAEGGAS